MKVSRKQLSRRARTKLMTRVARRLRVPPRLLALCFGYATSARTHSNAARGDYTSPYAAIARSFADVAFQADPHRPTRCTSGSAAGMSSPEDSPGSSRRNDALGKAASPCDNLCEVVENQRLSFFNGRANPTA